MTFNQIKKQMQEKQRRYDIDWWRVIAILAVYLHHIGMPFNGDDFHIMNAESSKILDDIMVFFEQLRLPLLFLISGVGTMYAFSKRTWVQFLKERSYRLLIPLVFGVFVIVPPQTYFEHIDIYKSYGQFYSHILSNIEVNHLWFIENLFYISVLSIPFILFLRSSRSTKIKRFIEKNSRKRYGILIWLVPLIVIKVISKIYFPDDSGSFENLSSTLFYGFFFVSGILMAASPKLWGHLKTYRRANLYIAIMAIFCFYGYYYLPRDIASAYLNIGTRWAIWHSVTSWVSWSCIIVLLGYGQIWFSKPSKTLSKANEAIYPFYVLHQTVIIIMAYYIVQLDLSIGVKIVLLLVSTFPVTLILYRFLVYPFKLTRILFGMKSK